MNLVGRFARVIGLGQFQHIQKSNVLNFWIQFRMAYVPIRLVLIVEHCFMYFLYYVKELLNVVTITYKHLQN